MTIQETLSFGKNKLKENSIVDGDLDAWLLLEFILKIDRTYYYLHLNDEIEEMKFKEYCHVVDRRSKHVPLQYITGVQEFMGLQFKVNSHVLIPRQDTEILVEEAGKKIVEGMDVLDMCTGSGCILISLMFYHPDIHGIGIDISKDALMVAMENAKCNKVKAQFISSDLFDGVTGKFDVIVSNPPYIPTKDMESLMKEVKEHEPAKALDGFVDGLYFYRRIISEGKKYLHHEGYLFFEIGYNQARDVCRLMEDEGYREIQIKKDLAGLDRVVFGRV